MAKVSNNIFIRGLSGNLGNQFSLRSRRNSRTTVAVITDYEDGREPSEAQLAHQLAFSEAIAYAQSMQGEEVYSVKADGTGMSPYNLAVADWFKAPQILAIDLDGWSSASGGLIRVRAKDNVQVVHVRVQITEPDGALLEEGQAEYQGGYWWEYQVAQAHSGTRNVLVFASDLPGNVTQDGAQKEVGG